MMQMQQPLKYIWASHNALFMHVLLGQAKIIIISPTVFQVPNKHKLGNRGRHTCLGWLKHGQPFCRQHETVAFRT